MKRYFAFILPALLAACVQTPAGSEGKQAQQTQKRAAAHTELGSAYYGAGQYDIALQELKAALAADPDYVPALNQVALVYLALGQTKEAQTNLERALRYEPNNPSVNNNYGMLLCQQGNEKEAMRYFNNALADPLYKTPELAYVNAGVCARMKGDDAQAEQYLTKALAMMPDQPQALYNLAEVAYRKGNLEKARGLITRQLQVSIPSADSLWLAARIESRLGDQTALSSYGAQLNRRFPTAPQTRAFNEGHFQ